MSTADIAGTFGGKSYFSSGATYAISIRSPRHSANTGSTQWSTLPPKAHVDRSIFGPKDFVETNINGTFSLLEAARRSWGTRKDVRFHHISTDEVYGSLGDNGFFFETTPYDPQKSLFGFQGGVGPSRESIFS